MWNFVFFFNSILLGVGLAMDAFSVSLANGLHEPKMARRRGGRLCCLSGADAAAGLAVRPHHCGAFCRF